MLLQIITATAAIVIALAAWAAVTWLAVITAVGVAAKSGASETTLETVAAISAVIISLAFAVTLAIWAGAS